MMRPPSDVELADYSKNVVYERKLVAFYDILGWREVTETAPDTPEAIGLLRREILIHQKVLHGARPDSTNVSTFSDNVVISAPLDEDVPNLLLSITLIQMMTQSRGLLLRGGVTIGRIVHDSGCVFGPGLNRAYDLERTIAKYPRIVLDPEVLQCGNMDAFVSMESGVNFLDPFKREFRNIITKRWNVGANREKLTTEETWQWEYDTFAEVMRTRKAVKERDKVAWVIDRIALHSGLPRAAKLRKAWRKR